jgi:hypothetical protein
MTLYAVFYAGQPTDRRTSHGKAWHSVSVLKRRFTLNGKRWLHRVRQRDHADLRQSARNALRRKPLG